MRHSFENPIVLKDFCANYLPEEISCQIKLDEVSLEHDSFVDEGLKEHLSDLLINAPLKGSGNTKIYVLFEHKSGNERFVMLQLLRYMVQIWEKERSSGNSGKDARLTPILPLIFHHGRSRMTAPVDFRELVQEVPGLESYTPDFSAYLVDLAVMSEEDMRGGARLMAINRLLKYIFSDEINRLLPIIISTLDGISPQPDVPSMIRTMIIYAFSGSDQITEEAVIEATKNVRNGGDIMNVVVEKWFKEGEEQGIAKGIAEGEERGEAKGEAKGEAREARTMILRTIELRFNSIPESLRSHIEGLGDHTSIEALLPAVISSTSIEGLLKDIGI